MQCIYKITNSINQKCYIGKTKDSQRRWKDHQRLAFTIGHKEYNKSLYCAMRKHGIEHFTFEIVEELDDYSLSGEREQYWVQYYDSYNNGYNESKGGDGGSDKGHCSGENNGRAKLTEEDIKYLRLCYSQGCSKKECYEQYKDKISESGFSRAWQGKTWSNIMPEVFTAENKQITTKRGQGQSAKQQRIYTNEEIVAIRKAKKEGLSLKDAFLQYGKTSINTFKDLWYGKTYKEIKE